MHFFKHFIMGIKIPIFSPTESNINLLAYVFLTKSKSAFELDSQESTIDMLGNHIGPLPIIT